jgi:hypothetical protein
MLFDRRRTATVVAATILELASLSKADFVHVIQEFPELAPEFEKNLNIEGYATVRLPVQALFVFACGLTPAYFC